MPARESLSSVGFCRRPLGSAMVSMPAAPARPGPARSPRPARVPESPEQRVVTAATSHRTRRARRVEVEDDAGVVPEPAHLAQVHLQLRAGTLRCRQRGGDAAQGLQRVPRRARAPPPGPAARGPRSAGGAAGPASGSPLAPSPAPLALAERAQRGEVLAVDRSLRAAASRGEAPAAAARRRSSSASERDPPFTPKACKAVAASERTSASASGPAAPTSSHPACRRSWMGPLSGGMRRTMLPR